MEKFTFNISGGKLEKENVRERDQIEVMDEALNSDGSDREMGIVQRQRKSRRRHTLLGTIAIVLVVILGFFLIIMMRHYNSFEVVSTQRVKGASSYKYTTFDGCLLKYGNDGAILTSPTGKVVWNEGFEMSTPKIDICKDYLIIYDRNGSKIFLMDTHGKVSEISTRLPISVAEVSENGTTAVVMKKDIKARVELYNKKQEVLASGELHVDNMGYPSDIALSSDGKTLMVSTIGYENGETVSKVTFYNFGKAGRNSIDNKVSTYKYKGTIIPEVDINDKGKPIAIGSDRIIIYSAKSVPAEKNTIKVEGEMKSVFYNEKYVGYVVGEADDKGELKDTVKLYSYRGFKRYSKKLDFDYRDIKILDDNEVYVTDGHKMMLINLFGINRFYINNDEEIFDVVNKKAGREFYLVKSDAIEQVKLSNR